MVDRTLALDDDEFGTFVRRVEYQLLRRTGRKIGNDAVDAYTPAGDEHAGLPGRDEARLIAGLIRRTHQLERYGHLSNCAVVSNSQDDGRGGVVRFTGKERHPRRFAHVPDSRSGGAGGGVELAILVEHLVQTAHDLQVRGDGF